MLGALGVLLLQRLHNAGKVGRLLLGRLGRGCLAPDSHLGGRHIVAEIEVVLRLLGPEK